MLRLALAIMRKDLRIMLFASGSLIQAILLGFLLIFIFSLSFGAGESATPRGAATIFWLATVFCQVLAFNQLYWIEEVNRSRLGLLLAQAPVEAIWLGKALAGFCLLLLAQIFFLPGIVIFLSQNFSGDMLVGFGAIGLSDIGLAAAGALLGSMAQGQGGRDALLSVLIFPLLLPLLLAAIGLFEQALGSDAEQSSQAWLSIGLAFDAIFIGASLALFGHIYQGEE